MRRLSSRSEGGEYIIVIGTFSIEIDELSLAVKMKVFEATSAEVYSIHHIQSCAKL